MGDLISREALIDFLLNVPFLIEHGLLKDLVIDWVNQQPSVEAVPVVRCKDCKSWIDHGRSNEFNKLCKLAGYYVGVNGYCCYADMRKKVQDGKIDYKTNIL